jgi:hypothetical protein
MKQSSTERITAPLRNVTAVASALDRAIQRPSHLPGLVTFYGPSGWGKSFGAAYAANEHRGYYVVAKSVWTRKAMLSAILGEMGIAPGRTLAEMADQVAEQLELSGRPLIIDESDYLCEKGLIDPLRDIYEMSQAAILIVGEEMLPKRLQRWERFHGRMLDWVQAQPADMDDARALARLYCDGVEVADDLLGRIQTLAKGSVRRISVNLEKVRGVAAQAGLTHVDLEAWGTRELFTGDAPLRRRGV